MAGEKELAASCLTSVSRGNEHTGLAIHTNLHEFPINFDVAQEDIKSPFKRFKR